MSLIKAAVTNPLQMAIQKNIADANPMQGLHYDRLTSLAAQAKQNPALLPKMRQAAAALKAGGVLRLDDAAKAGMKAALNKPVQMATVTPLKTLGGLLAKAK